MTQLTIRWIRVVAIVINVLVFIRQLASLTVFGLAFNLHNPLLRQVFVGLPADSTFIRIWVGLTLVAPLLAIVAIAAVSNKTVPLQVTSEVRS